MRRMCGTRRRRPYTTTQLSRTRTRLSVQPQQWHLIATTARTSDRVGRRRGKNGYCTGTAAAARFDNDATMGGRGRGRVGSGLAGNIVR